VSYKIRWPNAAEHAREDAIAEARRIIAQLAPIKDAIEQGKMVSVLELQIRIGRVSDAANIIIQELIKVGPQNFKEK
jgi:hypothetical protein